MGGTREFGGKNVSQLLNILEASDLKAMQDRANMVTFVGQCRVRNHFDGSRVPDGVAGCFFVDWFGKMTVILG